MADIFLMRSDDLQAVRFACSEVQKELSELSAEGTVDLIEGPSWSLITNRNPFVPYTTSRDPLGAAVVIGSTLNPDGPTVSDLRKRSPADRIQAAREFCRQLNYGVALSIEDGDLLIATDYLGLYPIYYYQDDSAFIVTSIPGLLSCYRGFCPAVDVQGLVGILLLAHSCLGRTLFRGVSRLSAGTLLKYGLNGRVTREEVAMDASGVAPKSMDETVEAFDLALRAAIGSAIRQGIESVLLSGGLDSRIAAGYLHRLSDGEVSAVTFGERGDLDMRAAVRVASAIGATHHKVSDDQSDYPVFAQNELNHDAMSSGLYGLNFWAFSGAPRRPMLTGFFGDALLGADYLQWGREPLCDLHTFHAMFTRVNSWGLSPGIVRELVRADDIDDIVLDVYRQLRDEYYSYPGQPWQRSWWFDILHRERFLVGRIQKIIAVRSWPVLPYVHPAVLQLASAMPLPFLSERKVEVELILRKFPALARQPFAGNAMQKWYTIVPRKRRPWDPYIGRVKDSLSWHLRKRLNIPENRFFVRAFDFNGAGWNTLRDQARTVVPGTDNWLNKDLVLQLIPPSTTRLKSRSPITDTTGRRTLIGTVLCCSQYFAIPRAPAFH